jgi:alanine racemase
VLSWRARIAQIKKVPAGADIGYGCTYRTTRPTVLAVVPVGYFDGYDRGLSNAAHVLIKGRRAPVRGRVAMDFFMADVTDVPSPGLEDEVTLLGADGRERITAEDLASLAGTISYEIWPASTPHPLHRHLKNALFSKSVRIFRFHILLILSDLLYDSVPGGDHDGHGKAALRTSSAISTPAATSNPEEALRGTRRDVPARRSGDGAGAPRRGTAGGKDPRSAISTSRSSESLEAEPAQPPFLAPLHTLAEENRP